MNDRQQLDNALSVIADYFRQSQGIEIKLQSGDVVISARHGSTLDGLEHKCVFATFAGDKIKKCVDCGKIEPLFGLEIKHPRDNGY